MLTKKKRRVKTSKRRMLGKWRKTSEGKRTFDGFELYEHDKELIVDAIRDGYKKQGWKVSNLSEWAGVSPSYIYLILNGKSRYVSLVVLWRLCHVMRIKIRAIT